MADYLSATNLVLLRSEIAAAFPTADAVNEALTGLLKVAESARITAHTGRARAKARDEFVRSP